MPHQVLKEVTNLENSAYTKFTDHQRRVWGELDHDSLNKLKTQENELTALLVYIYIYIYII